MTKAEIVDIIANSTGLTKVETEHVVNGFLSTVKEALTQGKHIDLRGFGRFKVVERKRRAGRNPRTNELVEIPEQHVPVLKFSKDFRADVNDSLAKS